MFNRVILIVMDSVGIGELPDAAQYNDQGSNTLGNIYREIRGFSLPNLEHLGLGNIEKTPSLPEHPDPCGCFGKAAEKSAGKDTTTGHWEMAGIILEKPFPTYPDGFPDNLIKKFEEIIGRKVLGNKAASGTVIIEELGQQHINTGYPIVYTSADSVFQIAAHEKVITVDELYDICRKARRLLTGDHRVARVIARPFVGEPGNLTRTSNRKDFSVEPPEKTLLDFVCEQGFDVTAVGKIMDIFSGKGITRGIHTDSNKDGISKTIALIKEKNKGLIFTNLVDFDMKYGHRNNVEGYASALKELDNSIPEIMESLRDDDVLILTADHGCDPTTTSTDHSREYVPVLVYGKKIKKGINIGIRESFTDIGATVADILEINGFNIGESFKNIII